MSVVAIVFAEAAPVTVAGGAPVDRQLRQLRHAGIPRIFVIGNYSGPRTSDVYSGPRTADVAVVATPAGIAAQIAADDAVLVLAPGLVVDERIVAAVLVSPVPTIATWPALGSHAGTERIDPTRVAAGVALLRGATVTATATTLGEWDFASTLLRAALGEGDATLLDLAALDTYAPARRRQVPPSWAQPRDAAAAAATDDMLIAAAQKGCLDWPARFLHPPVEDLLVRRLLPLPITPNMVTVVVALLGIAAGFAFAYGWLWTGLALVLVSGPLDGVDGKLARVRTEFSRWGDLEHVLDKLCEYGWYLCLAGHFAQTSGNAGPWWLAALLILFALAESLQGEFFRRFTGRQLDDAGPFERRFRLIGARRNTLFWTLLPFALLDQWYFGFAVMAGYASVTFFVMQYRFFVQLERYGRGVAGEIDANFRATAYSFLPQRERPVN